METPQGTNTSEITGNVLFYNKPEPLTVAMHGKLGVKKVDQPFGFMRAAHAIPLTISEFGVAATSYPIIFVGDDRSPVAVMGVRQGQNVFVDDKGMTEPDYYVPAFARRYPFVFATANEQEQLLLCIDRNAEMVSDQPEVPFFEGDQPSKFTNDALDFCKEFERQRQATQAFRELMIKHDLFEEKTINFQPRDNQGNESGAPQKVADYWAVSEEKVKNLSAEALEELRVSGSLGGIYAHLVSLLNWSRVIQRALRAGQPAVDS